MILRALFDTPPPEGSTTQIARDRAIARAGLRLNTTELLMTGLTGSLENSLIASLKGCRIPPVLTLFGPLRSWE